MCCVCCLWLKMCPTPIPGQVLMKYMIKPLIMYPSLLVEVSQHLEMGTVLSLQTEESQAERPTPADVYSKILLVLKMLHRHLFGTINISFISIILIKVSLWF